MELFYKHGECIDKNIYFILYIIVYYLFKISFYEII